MRRSRLTRRDDSTRSAWALAVQQAMVSADGWRVEPVVVQVSLARPGRQMLRVKRGPYFVADCRSVDEVAKHVDLAELIPEQLGGGA